ncbi:hypothetical protein T07_10502 [Trichinella nelsoni]|uniref:Integrase zinc-binding domain-containing protein n=1 Tax=Trichinella nelsoni TaxID=6336 RepID=A0A0V0S8E7_9BILA|nr:hypothetical protein T07_10502 [Trichinella nelsoni]
MTATSLDATSIFGPERFSDLKRLIRATAWCQCFIHNARSPRLRIRQAQIQAFGESDTASLHPMKRFQEFSPFLDEFCIQRDVLTELLIQREHLRQLHAGVEQTHSALREKFWILRGRSTVKRVLRGCTTCQRVSPPPYKQRMSELLEMRVEAVRPFVNVVPLVIRGHSPNRLMQKGYACIFSYIVVRAIHLELVSDVSIDSFLRALRRFITRRGRPAIMQSDNFQTFRQSSHFLQSNFDALNWKAV